MKNDYQTPALSKILEMVNTGMADGYQPENMLDDDELSLYREHESNLKPELESHFDNLAKIVDEGYLTRLAQDIVQWVRYDELSRKDWQAREIEGITMLGVTDNPLFEPPFEGASKLVHPLLAESVTEFHSRAIAEMFPPEGPVKTTVLGESTPELIDQADRVQDYMNYQYTEDMPGAFEEEDRLLFRLPISGSVFKKVFYDPLLKKVVTRMIEPADFIVPYSATDLQTAGRYTHRYRKPLNWLLQHVKTGFFIESKIYDGSTNDSYDKPKLLNAIDESEGKHRLLNQYDELHTIFETCAYIDVPGFEDMDEYGSKTNVQLPFKIWVDRDNQKVIRMQRNWLEEDDEKTPIVDVVHKKFSPGLGFYGFGLYHLIGGLGKAATGTLNALMDSAAFYNMQGGYRTRFSKLRGGEDRGALSPGEWRETDASADELRNAFFHIPYKEPSNVMFQLLGLLDDKSTGFIGGDIMTGDANPNAPVGTTLALIEQGAKKFSAIHRRLHVANRDEFRILARLNSQYLPDEGYPYAVKGGNNQIFPYDFDGRVDILPVSDPSIISNSQRIVQAQAILDLSDKHPDKIDGKEACRNMLLAMRVQDIDKLIVENSPADGFNQKLLELDVQIKQAELEKVKSEKAKLDAERTESAVRGLYSAIQAAQIIATMPAVAPMADEIYASAGGIDANGASIANTTMLQATPQQPALENPIEQQGDTSPQTPASPQMPDQGQTDSLAMPQMPSPEQGVMGGVNTMAVDS